MDLISLVSITLALIPIIYVLLVSRKSIAAYFRILKKRDVAIPDEAQKDTEYERILKSVASLEYATQPNTGKHHPEKVYLSRAHLIRTETNFYNLINSLK